MKRRLLIVLGHIYPKAVSGIQLAKLSGYSTKANALYRGPLKALQEESLVLVDKLTPRLFSIRINHEHPVMELLVKLCQEHGQEIQSQLENVLEEPD
ncbi:MAG: hypothetical protein ACFFCQ_14325 [Promethearchaeota archaeon]